MRALAVATLLLVFPFLTTASASAPGDLIYTAHVGDPPLATVALQPHEFGRFQVPPQYGHIVVAVEQDVVGVGAEAESSIYLVRPDGEAFGIAGTGIGAAAVACNPIAVTCSYGSIAYDFTREDGDWVAYQSGVITDGYTLLFYGTA